MNEYVESILISKNIAPTPMRIMILEYLQNQTSAVSLQDLELHFQYSDRTTIYRTLKKFVEMGLIHNIQDGAEATKYALCAAACKAGNHYDLHLHFYCYVCKRTVCLPRHQIPDISLPADFELKELNLVAKGVCDQCSTETMQ